MKAFPPELVARLEEFDMSAAERAGGSTVIQYRDHLMPLVTIDGSTQVAADGRRPVLVFTDRTLSLGLVVDEIVDIVEDVVSFDRSGTVHGTLGSEVGRAACREGRCR